MYELMKNECNLNAAAADSFTGQARRATEGSLFILATPGQGLAGVPNRAVDIHCIHVPLMFRSLVVEGAPHKISTLAVQLHRSPMHPQPTPTPPCTRFLCSPFLPSDWWWWVIVRGSSTVGLIYRGEKAHRNYPQYYSTHLRLPCDTGFHMGVPASLRPRFAPIIGYFENRRV